jgi:negative regulator of flagellin synthesis FlgM
MKINGSIFDPLRPDRATPAQNPAEPRSADPVSPSASGSAKSDSVQFSSAGRSMAGRLQPDQDNAFDPARVAELRTKVLAGAYNTLDIVDQVARRILTRGDL